MPAVVPAITSPPELMVATAELAEDVHTPDGEASCRTVLDPLAQSANVDPVMGCGIALTNTGTVV